MDVHSGRRDKVSAFYSLRKGGHAFRCELIATFAACPRALMPWLRAENKTQMYVLPGSTHSKVPSLCIELMPLEA